jgi:hypothetical protein
VSEVLGGTGAVVLQEVPLLRKAAVAMAAEHQGVQATVPMEIESSAGVSDGSIKASKKG